MVFEPIRILSRAPSFSNFVLRSEWLEVAHPERFELPTNWFEANYSIQLS
jgi:hypothetical protein